MSKTVMIIEDNELNMKLFRDLVQLNGHNVIELRSGLNAFTLVKEKKPDLILMDIQLPEISGLDIIKMLKNDDSVSDIPIIAVTAFAMKGDEERIREAGCDEYMSKPISINSFLATLKKFLED